MDNQPKRIAELFEKYLSNSLTAAERLEFLDYVDDPLYATVIDELIGDAFENGTGIPGLSTEGRARILGRILQQEAAVLKPGLRSLWPRIAAAASIVVALSVGSYWVLHKKAPVHQIAQNERPDIAPGSNKAILTLANGQKVILTGAKNGQIARQGLTVIQKTADGQVVYKASKSGDQAATVYNTMTTPRGGQHWVTLSDGSKVLLNAASSLTYPVVFTGNERKVTLTGEAYFEVVHNDRMPFRVVAKGETVEDIGTHFNINAYDDEPVIRTTLLEGGIRVIGQTQSAILKPGQEAVLKAGVLNVDDADTEQAVAWKNGQFMFESEPIDEVMKMVARWYDVEVIYNGEKPDDRFGGSVSRFDHISKVLNILQSTGQVHFRIEGRKIYVMK